jgi:HSP20 family protein
MLSLQHYTEKYPVYPGEYTSFLEPEDVEEEHRKRKDIKIKEPLVNVNESKDIFKIEVAVPGVKREENILSIIVVHKGETNEDRSSKLHEFDNDFLERHIFLPPGADIQFIRAEYKEGVLHFYLPKTIGPTNPVSASIIVY